MGKKCNYIGALGLGFRAGLLASVLWLPTAQAADTLNDALVKTYNSNPQLMSGRANLRATDEEVSQAIAQWRPKITLSGNYSHIETETKIDPTPLPGNPLGVNIERRNDPWDADVTATQTVFAGGRILAQRRQADAQVRAERARLHSIEQSVFLDTVTSFMNVVRDEVVVKLNQTNVELLRKQLEAAKARFDVGEITRTDVSQAEARLAGGLARSPFASVIVRTARMSRRFDSSKYASTRSA